MTTTAQSVDDPLIHPDRDKEDEELFEAVMEGLLHAEELEDDDIKQQLKKPRIQDERSPVVKQNVLRYLKFLQLKGNIENLSLNELNDQCLQWLSRLNKIILEKNAAQIQSMFEGTTHILPKAFEIAKALYSPPVWNGSDEELKEMIHYLHTDVNDDLKQRSVLKSYCSACHPKMDESTLNTVISMMGESWKIEQIIEIIKNSGNITRVNDEPIEVSRKAFQTNYELGDIALNHFKEFVTEAFSLFRKNPGVYHSLYFSIVQSSGTGKTRLVLESGQRELNVVYGCLRDSNSTGYPLGNDNLINFFNGNNDKDSLMNFLATAYITFYGIFIKFKTKYPTTAFPISRLEGDDIKFKRFWNLVIQLHTGMSKTERSNVKTRFKYLQSKEDAPDLVLVFDEASSLLKPSHNQDRSRFRNLRAALRDLESQKMLLIFIDTLSAVVHFQPNKFIDPSARPDLKFKLLPPFYEMLTMNCRPVDFNSSMDRETELMTAFAYGRPIWYAYYFHAAKAADFPMIVPKALRFSKIKVGFSEKMDAMLDIEASVAVCSIRFGISGVMDHTLASDLMSSYMGVGMFIGEDRLRMKVEYIPEPIIAEAACQLLHASHDSNHVGDYSCSEDRVGHALKLFTSKCLNGLVDAGNIGEITARVILSLAYDHVHLQKKTENSNIPIINSSHLFSDAVTVKEFLETLFGKEYREEYFKYFQCQPINFSRIPSLDGKIRFTSWIQLSKLKGKHIPSKLLQQCFHMRCAIILPLNQGGFDLIIPIQLFDNTYSFLAIQVKNILNTFSQLIQTAGAKLLPDLHFVSDEAVMKNAISIYMDVHPKTLGESMKSMNTLAKVFAEEKPNHEDESFDLSDLNQVIDEDEKGSVYFQGDEKVLRRSSRTTSAPRYKSETYIDRFRGQMQQFHRKYPKHSVLLGLESSFIKGKLLDILSDFRRKKIDPIGEESRSHALSSMNYITYCFSGKGCRCCDACAGNCPCVLKNYCSGACDCITLPEGSCPKQIGLFSHVKIQNKHL